MLTRFDQAEAAWEGDHEVLRVICATCDEPFEPRFRFRCHGCGYTFEGAAPVADPAERRTETGLSNLDRRSLLALVTLAAVVTGLIGYFAWLLRRLGRAERRPRPVSSCEQSVRDAIDLLMDM